MKLIIIVILITSISIFGKPEIVYKKYEPSCDGGMKTYSTNIIASLENTSVVHCTYKCQENPECRSIDYVTQDDSYVCNLLNQKWRSNCTVNPKAKHYVLVSLNSHERNLAIFLF